MPTKCIVIGQENAEPKKLKPIEFYKLLSANYSFTNPMRSPKSYDFIELISKNYCSNYDLMFAYDGKDRANGAFLYLGRWNDGVVEEK